MDFADINDDPFADEGWADDYSDASDEMAESGTITKSLDDIREEFGFTDSTELMFGNITIEDRGESEDSDDDDDDTTPIEFDDAPANPNATNSRKQPNLPCCSTPFWFGDEDPQHLQRLFAIYEKSIGLDKEKATVKRGDLPFVGRVLRRQVVDVTQSEGFWTIDAVDIYLNEQLPQGLALPIAKHLYTLTKWDIHNGLPFECVMVSRRSAKSQWKPRIRPGVSAWIYCLPNPAPKNSFTYSTGQMEAPMRQSNDKPFSYGQFLPKRSMEDEEQQLGNFMLIGSPGSSPQRPQPKFSF